MENFMGFPPMENRHAWYRVSYERGTEYLESGRSRGHTGQCNHRVDQGRNVILLRAVGPYVLAPLALSQPSTMVQWRRL
jgi:hypothetical protein